MMKKKKSEPSAAKGDAGRRFSLFLATLSLAQFMVGCTPIQRHSVLNFVFDGVGPYRTPEERARLKAEALESAGQEESFTRRTGRGWQQSEQGKLSRFVHGPYAAKECERCHDLGAASGFRGPGGGGALSPASMGDLAEAGRLLMPVDELCVHCHSDFASDAPENADLWMHGPAANGLCVSCHQSHSSAYAALVFAEPSARLCGQCHMREDLLEFTAEHRPVGSNDAYPPPAPPAEEPIEEADADALPPPEVVRVVADCTRCHDPHRGPERNILKARDEWGPEPVREIEPAPEFLPDPESAPEPDSETLMSRAEGPP